MRVPSWEQNVYSSMVQSVGYDADSSDLLITWKNGRRSAYSGVPEEVAVSLANAASVGEMMNSEIKPNYEHRYV